MFRNLTKKQFVLVLAGALFATLFYGLTLSNGWAFSQYESEKREIVESPSGPADRREERTDSQFDASLLEVDVEYRLFLRKFMTRVHTGSEVNFGVALRGMGEDQMILLELRDQKGNLAAQSTVALGGKSKVTKFIDELEWNTPIDLSNFAGSLTACGQSNFAASGISSHSIHRI